LWRGAAIERDVDIVLPGPVFEFRHWRTYDSFNKGDATPSGERWICAAKNLYLAQNGSNIELRRDSSSKQTFVGPPTSGLYTSPAGSKVILEKTTAEDKDDVDNDSDSSEEIDVFILTYPDEGDVYIFGGFDNDLGAVARGRLLERTLRAYRFASKRGIRYKYTTWGVDYAITAEPQGWMVNYTYRTSGATAGRLDKIEVYNASTTGGTLIQKAEYKYFDDESGTYVNDLGSSGDLIQVKKSQLATDGTSWIESYTQYRYHTSSSSLGGAHQLKFVFEPAAVERIMALGASYDTAPEICDAADATVDDYASRSFTYYVADEYTNGTPTPFGTDDLETDYGGTNLNEHPASDKGRVLTETVNGACSGCGASGGLVTYTYCYMTKNDGTTNPNQVERIIVEDVDVDQTADNSNEVHRRIYGLNYQGVALRQVLIKDPDAGTLKPWCWSTTLFDVGNAKRDGRFAEMRLPSAHDAEVTSNATIRTFLNPAVSTNDSATLDAAGTIYAFDYVNAGGGRANDLKVRNGESATERYLQYSEYGDAEATPDGSGKDKSEEYLPIQSSVFTNVPSGRTDTTNRVDTKYDYAFWDATNDVAVQRETTTLTAIVSGENGNGQTTTKSRYFDKVGRLRWTQDGEGYVNYYSYHPKTGRLAYFVLDVDPTSMPSDASNQTTKWVAATDSGAGTYSAGIPTRSGSLPTALAIVHRSEYDDLGRLRKTIHPDPSHATPDFVAYEALAFNGVNRMRVSKFPAWGGGTSLPVESTLYTGSFDPLSQLRVSNAATSITGGSTPTGIGAPALGDYRSLTSLTYDGVTGHLRYVDRYHSIPGSLPGTMGTDYHRTGFKYDAQGRRSHIIDHIEGTSTASGIERVTAYTYDLLDRITKIEQGFSQSDEDVGSTYTNLPATKPLREITYDNDLVGDSHVTKTKSYFGITSLDFMQLDFYRTYRGHLRGVQIKNNTSEVLPNHVFDVDWLGRQVGAAKYVTSFNGTTWNNVLTSEGYTNYLSATSTDRTEWRETAYDKRGRVYRTDYHPGLSANKLRTNSYYDRNDRLVAKGDKYSAHAEYAYDGAGRRYQSRLVKDVQTTLYDAGANYVFNYCQPKPAPTLTDLTNMTAQGVVAVDYRAFDPAGNVVSRHLHEVNHGNASGIAGTSSYVRRTIHAFYDVANRLTAVADYGASNSSSGNTWQFASTPSRPASLNWTDADVYNGVATLTKYGYAHTTKGAQTWIEAGVKKNGASDTDYVRAKTFYDHLGRRRYVVENHLSSYDPMTTTPMSSAASDKTTGWTYDGLNQVVDLTAYNSNSTSQVTKYRRLYPKYAGGSPRDWLESYTAYPDSTDTPPSGSDWTMAVVSLDGRLRQFTDQNGTVHDYTYNNRRQLEFDKATTLGTNIDGLVRSIKRTYDSRGRLENVYSYSDTAGAGTVRNRINNYYYDSLSDNIGKFWFANQYHDATTPYSFTEIHDTSVDGSGIYNDQLRTAVWVYPKGSKLAIRRGHADALQHTDNLDDRLGRITAADFSPTGAPADYANVADYAYNGASRLVSVDYSVPDVKREMFNSGTPTNYDAFDRFGRTLRQEWDKYNTGAGVRDQFNYAYDYAGNRLSRDIPSGLYATNDRDETYVYDGLLRLSQSNNGTYSSGMIADASAKFRQKWALDTLGNWPAFQQDGLLNYSTLADNDFADATDIDQTRDHNKANEIDDDEIDGNTPSDTITVAVPQEEWLAPQYDKAGNMRAMPRPSNTSLPYLLVYDAWNRLVEVKTTTTTVQKNKYDGLHRRIVKEKYAGGSLNETRHYYYNEKWQVVEERLEVTGTIDTDPINQYVWHPHYVDSLAMRRYDANTDGDVLDAGEENYYYLQDDNYNVTAVADSTGAVVERYVYSSYGVPIILNGASDADAGVGDFSVDVDKISDVANNYLYTGRERDAESGLQLNRNRFYACHLGRWLTRDPIGFWDTMNLNEYVTGQPLVSIDPLGLNEGTTAPEFFEQQPTNQGPLFGVFVTWNDENKLGHGGHAFVGVYDPSTGNMQITGFYPDGTPRPGSPVPSMLKDDKDEPFREGRVWPIDKRTYSELCAKLDPGGKPLQNYDPINFNCSAWAVCMMEEAGVGMTSDDITGNLTNTPGTDLDTPRILPIGLGHALSGWGSGAGVTNPPNTSGGGSSGSSTGTTGGIFGWTFK
jgi:RHS repeat-associated protein